MEPVTYIWMDGELVAWEDATVHVLSHALHYGTGVFEGIRAYDTESGPAVFRLTEHMERLTRGAAAYQIALSYGADELTKAAREVIATNELGACYIRPLVFLGTGSMGLNPAGAKTHVAIAAWRWGAYLGDEGLRNGIRVGVSSWRRLHQTMFIPDAKGTGGYINSILARLEANAAGFDEALLLNLDGYVAEGSGENLFLVRNGVVRTPPPQAGALDGITRQSVIELLRDDGAVVEETNLTRSDVYYADEAFFTGTAAEVTPIREVDHRTIGPGTPGPVTKRAQELFMNAVTGRLDDYRHWLEYI
ncbi:MAG: branched-chain amino acid transaminase [Acidimicrobiia bacterium]|nr:branched-chain amino acid transaminase [Acidimicrobiia bacterium]NNF10755.1 branched-chain amino acid transaminase [Acidimicrobiia bacterium]NNL69216.1 branched-chain amino acid transaminase [Acidimicrobiia bacterium]